eukprot:m.612890 g.612890  ORF g.612890 m.612890 type:complete len:70 (+) comp58147_c0_seq34:1688-1897(+)
MTSVSVRRDLKVACCSRCFSDGALETTEQRCGRVCTPNPCRRWTSALMMFLSILQHNASKNNVNNPTNT